MAASYDRKREESGRQAQTARRGAGNVGTEPQSSLRQSALEELANRSERVSQLKALQKNADGNPRVRQTAQLQESMANRPQTSEVAQRVTGVGVLGGLGTLTAGAAYLAGAPYFALAGLGLAGASAVYKWWRGAPETAAPSSKRKLSKEQEEALRDFRDKAGIEPLDVGYDAAFTDEVAGRRREKNAYRQWQIGSASGGTALGKDGEPLQAGRYMYVVTTGNEFRYLPMAEKGKDHFEQYRTHSQLAGKQKVYAAGAFEVGERGEILEIDNESGHYRPGKVEHAGYARELLEQLGVDVKGTNIRAHDSGKDPKGKDWLKGQGKANLRALRTWIPLGGTPGWKHGFADPGSELEKDLPF